MKDSLKSKAYLIIKEKILNCEYIPGTVLNEETLKADINVSRTPIREALSRLESEGLIQVLPKKGILVTELSPMQINKIYEARLLIEPYSLQHYGSSISDDVFMDFYHKFDNYSKADNLQSQQSEFYKLDDLFHRTIVGATKNSFFISAYESLYNQNVRLRIMSGRRSNKRLHDTNKEHLTIIRYCLSNEWDKASSSLHDHITLSRDAMFDILLYNNTK